MLIEVFVASRDLWDLLSFTVDHCSPEPSPESFQQGVCSSAGGLCVCLGGLGI